jgi:hypothetical protein
LNTGNWGSLIDFCAVGESAIGLVDMDVEVEKIETPPQPNMVFSIPESDYKELLALIEAKRPSEEAEEKAFRLGMQFALPISSYKYCLHRIPYLPP